MGNGGNGGSRHPGIQKFSKGVRISIGAPGCSHELYHDVTGSLHECTHSETLSFLL